jgi:predicted ATP-grasp superfamily ATP-dependent carboligase
MVGANQPPALIIGGGGANGLGIARNLGRRGIAVYCVTSNSDELSRYSRYCAASWIIPKIEDDRVRLERFLTRFQRRHPKECVLFPTTDTALLTLTQIQGDLDGYRYVIPDRVTAKTMVMKSRFYLSLRGSGLKYPVTLDPERVPFTEICQRLTFPVFIRPIQTLVFLEHFRGKGFVATSPDALQRYLTMVKQHQVSVLVQQIIHGPTANGFIVKGYFTRAGTPTIVFAVQKILQPSTFANSSIIVTIPVASIADFVTPFLTYLRHQQYRGLFSAELKRDVHDGQLKLLEVNARSTGDSYMGRACGADDIYAAYRDALGLDVPSPTTYTLGYAYVNEFTSLHALFLQASRGQLSKHAFDWIVRQKYWRTVARDDLRPVIIELKRYIARLPRLVVG